MSEQLITVVSGTVVQDDLGRLFVDVPRMSACQSCSKSKGCGTSMLGSLGGTKDLRFRLKGKAEVGDTIRLVCDQDDLVRAAFLAYMPPAVGMVLGGASAALSGSGDGVQALCALGGLCLGLILTRGLSTRDRVPAMQVIKE